MVSESGAELLEPSARSALVEQVLARATVTTPNLHEARALLGRDPSYTDQVEEVARAGPRHPGTRAIRGGDHRRAPRARD